MASAFHWVRVKAVCYATENEDLIHDAMVALIGKDDDDLFEADISEGLHGNPITVIDAELTRSKDIAGMFTNLGKDVISDVLENIGDRVDDDCVLYLRVDKQRAVCGEYVISHTGDVISITAKIAAHPAKKDIAVRNAAEYLTRILSKDLSSE